MGYYTIGRGDTIKSPSFSKKTMYHRPLRQEILVETGFFNESVPDFKERYNTFSGLKEVVYINGKGGGDYTFDVYEKLLNYCQKSYSVFDIKSLEEIESIFKNKAFHNFLFFKDGEISDYLCFFQINSSSTNSKYYRNACLYSCFFTGTGNLVEIFNSISNYCYKYDILDLITVVDIFPQSYYKKLNFIEGTGSLYYYMFNMNMVPVENSRNALVTI
jgi:hypothetical protein